MVLQCTLKNVFKKPQSAGNQITYEPSLEYLLKCLCDFFVSEITKVTVNHQILTNIEDHSSKKIDSTY